MASSPRPRDLVASIVSAIDIPTGSSDYHIANPLINASPSVQNALLTLHVLFPNELLPALDLLDRGLITRLELQNEAKPNQTNPDDSNEPDQFAPGLQQLRGSVDPGRNRIEVYMVRSGQTSARSRVLNRPTSYEVRLDAWTCSCPAFAFAAFPASPSELDLSQMTDPPVSQMSWKVGGLSLGNDMPLCKHLLACVLLQHSPVFAGFVEKQQVSIEELAGWAAGWGD